MQPTVLAWSGNETTKANPQRTPARKRAPTPPPPPRPKQVSTSLDDDEDHGNGKGANGVAKHRPSLTRVSTLQRTSSWLLKPLHWIGNETFSHLCRSTTRCYRS